MKIVGVSGSKIGTKTRIALEYVMKGIKDKYPYVETAILDLAEYDVQFSDGRAYWEYEGDTKFVAETIMDADAIIFGTPIFQASIPAPLKNIFDLLPGGAFQDKVAAIVVTAGTSKHYLVAEQHLKPILSYMKAHIVPSYVFIEQKDFHQKEIINDDILIRIKQLAEETVLLTESFAKIKERKEAEYGL